MAFPVCGLRASPALRRVTVKTPKPMRRTSSPCRSALMMFSIVASTASPASPRVSRVSLATLAINSSKPNAVRTGNDKLRGIRKSPAKKNIFESQINGLWRGPNKSRRNKDAPPADYLEKVIRIGLNAPWHPRPLLSRPEPWRPQRLPRPLRPIQWAQAYAPAHISWHRPSWRRE
jgi:hypothetical protein